MNKKIGAVALLVLMSLAVALTPIAIISGQNSLGVQIYHVAPITSSRIVTPQSQYNGTAGQAFNLEGTIYYSYSSYQVIFGKSVVATGTSSGYYVNANFTVPYVPGGSYDLTLRDVKLNVNSTGATPESFLVLTDYSITAVPSQTQEGSSVALTVSVTGGDANAAYAANVSVVLPSPLKTEYSTIVSMGTSTQAGTASAQITYPDSSFQPINSINSTTDYVGTYTVYFNQSLAQNKFSVGFLDSTTYHRGDTVTIGAIGYQTGQAATLSITNDKTGATVNSQSLTATADGIINATWQVPSTAVIGDYNVTITPTTGTQKAIQDVETFSIPGYSIQIETVNLASQLVSKILVKALDVSGTVYSSTSGSNGIADFNLETGTYPLTAFWNGVNIGGTSITVTGNGTFTMICQLTDLKITVQNENGITLPFVNLTITYQYQPTTGAAQTGNASALTDLSGTYTLNSTLTGIRYTINASVYNQNFNSGNNTVNNLPAQAVSEVVIICPNEALTLNVVGYNRAAISGARIDLVELTSGLFYTNTTDSSGSATSEVTFGTYQLQVYEDNILINETKVEAFGANQQQIICNLYGIQVSVSVVDFFGTPIPNANVTLNGPATERFSAMTQGNGAATFNNVIGGDMQIVAFAQGAQNSYQAVTLTVDKPTSVQIQIDRYIVLGPFLIPVSSFITLIIILVAIVLLATVEIYRRKKGKP